MEQKNIVGHPNTDLNIFLNLPQPSTVSNTITDEEIKLLLCRAMEDLNCGESLETFEREASIKYFCEDTVKLKELYMSNQLDRIIENGDAITNYSKSVQWHFYRTKFHECILRNCFQECEKLLKILQELSNQHFRMQDVCFLMLDGLDECKDSKERDESLSRLRNHGWEKIRQAFYSDTPSPRRLFELLEKGLVYEKLQCICLDNNQGKQSKGSDIDVKSGLTHSTLIHSHTCNELGLPNQMYAVLHGHLNEVWNLNISPSNKYLLSMSRDNTLCLWYLGKNENNQLVCVGIESWIGHDDAVFSADWSPDERYVISGGGDTNLILWNVADLDHTAMDTTSSRDSYYTTETKIREPALKFKAGPSCTTALRWLTNTVFFATGYDKTIKVFKIYKKNESFTYSCTNTIYLNSKVQDAVVLNDRRRIVLSTSNRLLNILNVNLAGKDEINDIDDITPFRFDEVEVIRKKNPISTLCASNLGPYVLANTMAENPLIELWNIDRKALEMSYSGHNHCKYVVHIAFGGPFEKYIISGSEDSTIFIWSRLTADILCTIEGHSDIVNSIVWLQMDQKHWLISASDDTTIAVWSQPPLEVPAEAQEVKTVIASQSVVT